MKLLSGFLKASLHVKIAPLMLLGCDICINHHKVEVALNARCIVWIDSWRQDAGLLRWEERE